MQYTGTAVGARGEMSGTLASRAGSIWTLQVDV
jgi:hypothetical protein